MDKWSKTKLNTAQEHINWSLNIDIQVINVGQVGQKLSVPHWVQP